MIIQQISIYKQILKWEEFKISKVLSRLKKAAFLMYRQTNVSYLNGYKKIIASLTVNSLFIAT